MGVDQSTPSPASIRSDPSRVYCALHLPCFHLSCHRHQTIFWKSGGKDFEFAVISYINSPKALIARGGTMIKHVVEDIPIYSKTPWFWKHETITVACKKCNVSKTAAPIQPKTFSIDSSVDSAPEKALFISFSEKKSQKRILTKIAFLVQCSVLHYSRLNIALFETFSGYFFWKESQTNFRFASFQRASNELFQLIFLFTY